MTDEDMLLLADNLRGTPDSIDTVLEALELTGDVSEIQADLLNYYNLECCPSCGLWVDSDDLNDDPRDPDGPMLCYTCREN